MATPFVAADNAYLNSPFNFYCLGGFCFVNDLSVGEIYANYNLMLLPSFNKWPVPEADKQIIYPVQNHALLGGTAK